MKINQISINIVRCYYGRIIIQIEMYNYEYSKYVINGFVGILYYPHILIYVT